MRVDCHADTALWLLEKPSLMDLPEAHQDYRRICACLDLAFLAIFIDEGKHPHDTPRLFRNVLSLLGNDILAHKDQVLPLLYREQLSNCDQLSSLDSAICLPKLILLGAEGAAGLGMDSEFLDEYYDAGLRFIGPTWNYANKYAGGCATDFGFTQEGLKLIDACNRKGILLDGAHLNQSSFWQLIANSKLPIIISHTCCAGLYEHRRNINDEQMIALAKKNGVMGITFVADFLGGAGDLKRLCEHIEYAVALIGSQHVALGSDFDGCQPHEELAGVEKISSIYKKLSSRGMDDKDIANIAGLSVVALLKKVLPSCKNKSYNMDNG